MPAASLRVRLTAAFALVALVATGLFAAQTYVANLAQFRRDVLEQDRSSMLRGLASYYAAHGSWDGVRQFVDDMSDLHPPPGVTPPAEPDGPYAAVDADGVVVLPVLGMPAGRKLAADALAGGEPIVVAGKRVGTLLTTKSALRPSPGEHVFIDRTREALLVGGLGSLAVAVACGLGLGWWFAGPLQELTAAARAIARGELEQRVRVRSRDEVGQLAEAFNRMSEDVARQVRLRRRMTADVAHDLRTPLTVIAGYVEAMRDGTLPATPERLELVYAEVEHLQRLVADLRVLSQADAGELRLNLQALSPAELARHVARAHEHAARLRGVELTVEEGTNGTRVLGDEAQLARVLHNLVDNALEHTPAGGRVTIATSVERGRVLLAVRDTGSGIAPEDMPRVFDRFYRADRARSDAEAHSGLGLAIVRALVEAHGGAVDATSTPGQGTDLVVRLPRAG